MNSLHVKKEVRDEVVDYIRYWERRSWIKRSLLLPVLGVRTDRFKSWENRYGLENIHNGNIPRDFWIEDWEREEIIDFYCSNYKDGYRSIAYMLLDEDRVCVSPSTVYRVLKKAGYMHSSSKESQKGSGFVQPIVPHEHWHIDISYLNIKGTFYYFFGIIDGCSRYIVHWEIRESMTESDAAIIIQRALEKFPGEKPRLISDNGPQFIAKDFKEYIRNQGMDHVRTSPYYPQSNGKIERFNGTLKVECIRPKTPISKEDADKEVAKFINHYNYKRLHSAIGYITPADKLNGKEEEIFSERKRKMSLAKHKRIMNNRLKKSICF
jgi:putative transposase